MSTEHEYDEESFYEEEYVSELFVDESFLETTTDEEEFYDADDPTHQHEESVEEMQARLALLHQQLAAASEHNAIDPVLHELNNNNDDIQPTVQKQPADEAIQPEFMQVKLKPVGARNAEENGTENHTLPPPQSADSLLVTTTSTTTERVIKRVIQGETKEYGTYCLYLTTTITVCLFAKEKWSYLTYTTPVSRR
jgi:hypothetical protein